MLIEPVLQDGGIIAGNVAEALMGQPLLPRGDGEPRSDGDENPEPGEREHRQIVAPARPVALEVGEIGHDWPALNRPSGYARLARRLSPRNGTKEAPPHDPPGLFFSFSGNAINSLTRN